MCAAGGDEHERLRRLRSPVTRHDELLAIGIEAGNNGIGEPWSDAQQDAYVKWLRSVDAAYGITADRVHSHQEWAPTRKSDPAGPSRWATSGTWAWMGSAVMSLLVGGPTVPPPHPASGGDFHHHHGEDDEDMMFDGIWKRDNHDACYAIFKDGTKQWLMDLGYIQGEQNLQRMRGATEEMVNVRTQNDPGLFARDGDHHRPGTQWCRSVGQPD